MMKSKKKIQKKNLHSFFINKKLIKNKKSQLFMIVLVLITLIAFTSLYAIMLTKKNDFKREIGERQFSIFKANVDSQKVLFYIDQSAEFASKDATVELAMKGGFGRSDCGDYFGFNLWNENVKECMPTEPEKEYKEIYFKKSFEALLAKYPGDKIPASYEYYYTQNNEKLHGKIGDPILIEIKNG